MKRFLNLITVCLLYPEIYNSQFPPIIYHVISIEYKDNPMNIQRVKQPELCLLSCCVWCSGFFPTLIVDWLSMYRAVADVWGYPSSSRKFRNQTPSDPASLAA